MRKIEREGVHDGLWTTLVLSCGHKASYPIWRSAKGPSYRPQRIRCIECEKSK